MYLYQCMYQSMYLSLLLSLLLLSLLLWHHPEVPPSRQTLTLVSLWRWHAESLLIYAIMETGVHDSATTFIPERLRVQRRPRMLAPPIPTPGRNQHKSAFLISTPPPWLNAFKNALLWLAAPYLTTLPTPYCFFYLGRFHTPSILVFAEFTAFIGS